MSIDPKMSSSTVKCSKTAPAVMKNCQSDSDNAENEDPCASTVRTMEYVPMRKLSLEDDDPTFDEYNLRPSFANFDDNSYHQPQLTTDIVRNMGAEFAFMERDNTIGPDEEKIRTYLRIRPSSKHVKAEPFLSNLYTIEGPGVLKINGNPMLRRNNPYADETKFTFTRVMGPDCSQSTVFEECVQPIVESFFSGDSCLIFSYGATNSGKTFTMQGYGTQFGIVPRTLDHIFNFLEDKLYTGGNIKPNLFNGFHSLSEMETKNLDDVKQRVLKEVKPKSAEMNSFRASFRASASNSALSSSSGILGDKILNINSVPQSSSHNQYPPNVELYAVWVSFAEIYNERVYDLFENVTRGKRRKELKLLTDKEGRVYIKDLTELCANSAEEAYQLFVAGKNNLQFAVTQANSNSSRSHSFFNIRMIAVGIADKVAYPKRVFQMSFCDLAGIERISQTGNVGARLKESNNINQSLFVLLKCIRAMRAKQQQRKHAGDVLPFRESKLARLFQGFLTSATHTCMIVNINPEPDMFETSLHVLQNSAIASEIITYRRVEPPVNDTKFGRRVRDSIGYSNQIKETLNLTETFNETLYEDDDEDFAAATVVAKSKIPAESMSDKISRLEIENASLRNELNTVGERIRKEMLQSFAEIQQRYEEEQREIARELDMAQNHLSDRRMSLAVKVSRSCKEDKQVGTSPMRLDQPQFDHSISGTCTPPNKSFNFKTEWKKSVQEALDLQTKIENLTDRCQSLQNSLQDTIQTIAKLETEKVENDSVHAKIVADLRHLLELKEEEMVRVKQDDPTKMNDENLAQIQKLSGELKKVNETVAQNERDLEEALITCMNYHNKLEEANGKITTMSLDLNKLHQKNVELVEDNELMHFHVEDLNKRLEESQKTNNHYEGRQTRSGKRGYH
ncbi:unnamed protein product [Allacma fusca]|uniref:Kinesin motor domain-containing protein n=1 Tax=Allacma fusca TaxID=39272 RepID=A0A8J2K517_9HEXA|nr:unnamed protein product [Allacma fusca]